MSTPDYCKGDPCPLHELHRFTFKVAAEIPGPPDAGAVIACGLEHAQILVDDLPLESEPYDLEEAEEADSDDLAYCSVCR